MWSYIVRRLLLMIPTLFGVTVVSFCVMQLAPGDPLLNQLGPEGAVGESTQTREAYLIQKRELKLDKPLLLNFRGFVDYREAMRRAAHYRAASLEEIRQELPLLGADPRDPELRARLRFLRSLGIEDFDARLGDPRQHRRLAEAVRGLVQIYCEDVGAYAVPAAMSLLGSDRAPLETKIGLVDCLQFMVVRPHQYTFSEPPSEEETPRVTRVWETWWNREKEKFPELDADREKVLRRQWKVMTRERSRTRLFELIQDEYLFDRSDMRFFIEKLLGESTLREKAIAATILKLYVAHPLQMALPYQPAGSSDEAKARRKPTADREQLRVVARNWLLHYDLHRADYQLGLGRKLAAVLLDTQYAHMVRRLATFHFGSSALRTREPVSRKIWEAVKVSAPLMLMAELVIYFVAVPLGILCSVSRGRFLDRLITLKLFFLYSIPPFVAGMLFLLFFCYGDYAKWFPMGGLHSQNADSFGLVRYWLDYLWHGFLPVVCLSLFSLAGLAMYSRTSMLDVIGQDYIRTARAKGLPEYKVILKHALRNGLIPILTLFSNFLPAMLGGSVLIEYLFNIPGMGRLSWQSIEAKDFPTLMALIYIQAIVVLLSILLTDLLYVLVDPRISFEGQGKSA